MKKLLANWYIVLLVIAIASAIAFFSVPSSKAIDAYLKLLIAVLGFIAPVIALAFPIFDDGFVKLQVKNNEEIRKKETELKVKMQEKEIPEIKKQISNLEKEKEEYQNKLNLLSIKKQVKRLFIPLICSVIFLCAFFCLIDIFCVVEIFWFLFTCLLISIILLSYSIYVIWELLEIIIEVKKEIEKGKMEKEEEKIKSQGEIKELLREIINTSDASVPKEKIKVLIDDIEIKDDFEFEVSIPVNVEQELKVSTANKYDYTIKNIELGFIFNNQLSIKENSGYYIYENIKEQNIIVRYNIKEIRYDTRLINVPISITGKTIGEYRIQVFIKGDKIKGSIVKFITIKVIDATVKSIKQEIKK